MLHKSTSKSLFIHLTAAEKVIFSGCSKTPRCKAPLPSPKRLRAGRQYPEAQEVTNNAYLK
jgi:hypothetical protein